MYQNNLEKEQKIEENFLRILSNHLDITSELEKLNQTEIVRGLVYNYAKKYEGEPCRTIEIRKQTKESYHLICSTVLKDNPSYSFWYDSMLDSAINNGEYDKYFKRLENGTFKVVGKIDSWKEVIILKKVLPIIESAKNLNESKKEHLKMNDSMNSNNIFKYTAELEEENKDLKEKNSSLINTNEQYRNNNKHLKERISKLEKENKNLEKMVKSNIEFSFRKFKDSLT